MTWRYHTPERDGHAPDDWVEGMEWQYLTSMGEDELPYWCSTTSGREPKWAVTDKYRYRPLQDATVEPSFDTLKDQCLRLPQDQREALIEAMQKPVRDWADEVAHAWWEEQGETLDSLAALIRSMCRPKEVDDIDGLIDALEIALDTLKAEKCCGSECISCKNARELIQKVKGAS